LYIAEILEFLEQYHSPDDTEQRMVEQTRQFLLASPHGLSRNNLPGHMTASVWLLNSNHDAVLLLHHRKLGRWLQPGGHVEDGESVREAALREAVEETGIKAVRFLQKDIFDVDVHEIPARGGVAAHLHYDIRFLMEADGDPVLSHESNAVTWVALSRIEEYSCEESILRLARKTHSWGGEYCDVGGEEADARP
jgi:8-oxo-dGTP pyrophosphatase MutT (NUDIX family)